jgi:hypothetical protein
MKSILIVRWYDVYEMQKGEVILNEMYEHDDIVQTLQHTEIEIRLIEVRVQRYLVHDIMIYIIVQAQILKLLNENR